MKSKTSYLAYFYLAPDEHVMEAKCWTLIQTAASTQEKPMCLEVGLRHNSRISIVSNHDFERILELQRFVLKA